MLWGQCHAQSITVVSMQSSYIPHTLVYYERGRLSSQRTKVVNAVFPPPLGPTSKNVGNSAVLDAFLYSNECSKTGKRIVIANVTKIVDNFGDSAWVSQLSSSYQAMILCRVVKPSPVPFLDPGIQTGARSSATLSVYQE